MISFPTGGSLSVRCSFAVIKIDKDLVNDADLCEIDHYRKWFCCRPIALHATMQKKQNKGKCLKVVWSEWSTLRFPQDHGVKDLCGYWRFPGWCSSQYFSWCCHVVKILTLCIFQAIDMLQNPFPDGQKTKCNSGSNLLVAVDKWRRILVMAHAFITPSECSSSRMWNCDWNSPLLSFR